MDLKNMNLTIITGMFNSDIKDYANDKFKNKARIEYPEKIGHPSIACENFLLNLKVKYKRKCNEIVLLTQSSDILNFIGYLISVGKLDSSKINGYILELDKNFTYDNLGYLNGFPYGYLNANFDKIIDEYL